MKWASYKAHYVDAAVSWERNQSEGEEAYQECQGLLIE